MSTEANSQPTQPQVSLTVNDLQILANIIDTCNQRGAFKADELETVGSVFNKLVAFISQITPAAPTEQPPKE